MAILATLTLRFIKQSCCSFLMIITPKIKNTVALNCYPQGCGEAVKRQINYVKEQVKKETMHREGSKRVLILGASSGLGLAKKDLQQQAERMQQWLKPLGGDAWVVVCKALVTKASVFIPALSPYIMALFKVMKAMGLHEGCIEQMYRLFSSQLYPTNNDCPQLDSERMIRIDDWELREDVQTRVNQLLKSLTAENFKKILDYHGLRQEFLQLNGFGFDG